MNEQTTWEEFSDLDQEWAILTLTEKKFGRWSKEEFFKTGQAVVGIMTSRLKENMAELVGKKALDFGCGIGRNTKALAQFFLSVDGVDISQKMILEAKRNKEDNINYFMNTADDLSFGQDKSYDLVFSVITLQHQQNIKRIIKYLKEFQRIAKDSGAIYFQLPSVSEYNFLKKQILKIRGVLYFVLKNFFFIRPDFLYSRLKLAPYMPMNYLKSGEIKNIFENWQVNIFDDNTTNTTYLITK